MSQRNDVTNAVDATSASAKREAVFAKFAEARTAQDRMLEIQRKSGYHPHAVFEDVENAAKFDHWFALLPDDLTHVLLEPLYLLAATGDQMDALRKREKSWQPNPDNLGDKYNGPLGKDNEAMPHNLQKWRQAVEAKRRAHLNRFKADLEIMDSGDVPEPLRGAAMALVALARSADGEGDIVSAWDGCTGGRDVPATAAAIRLCLSALVEHDTMARSIACEVAGELRQELTVIEKLEGGVTQ